MDGKQILGFTNYFMLGLVFLFGLMSLALFDQRKKMTFLFLMFLSTGLLSFLFFAGLSFVVPAIILLGFCSVLFLFINNQEFYGAGKAQIKSITEIKKYRFLSVQLVLNFVIAFIVCGAAGLIFVIYTKEYFANTILVARFNTSGMADIINEISANYIPVIILISFALICSLFWLTGILENRRKRN